MRLLLVLACARPEEGEPPDPPGPPILAPPRVSVAPAGVYLAHWFDLDTSAPTTLTVTIRGPERTREIAFPTRTTRHHVPLLELRPDTSYEVSAEITVEDGTSWEIDARTLLTEPLPPVPSFRPTVSEPDRMEPGLTLMPVTFPGEAGWIVALDADGAVVYVQEAPDLTLALTPTADGAFALVDGDSVAIRAVMGGTTRRWTATPSEPEDVAVDLPFHHEQLMQPDGSFFSVAWRLRDVPRYPTSYLPPLSFAPATVRDDVVVHVAADGTTLEAFSMVDLLDARHIGFDALTTAWEGGLDWGHANALQYDADADELTVSLRHQDAVVRFSRATGELKWIFAPPDGWPPELEPYLLVPTEPFVWPTHQHGIQLGDGRLRLFDNGNNSRDTPYYDSGQIGIWSRVFEVAIDEEARTATPVAEFASTSTGPLFSMAFGNADLLPITGNRLATWGANPRIVEIAEDGTVVFEVLVRPGGWKIDRALRIPSLYPPDVTVTEY